MWFEQMHPGWQSLLADKKSLLQNIEEQVGHLAELVPERTKVMAAFEVNPSSIRVIVIGQDPYPTSSVAIGHAFAVHPNSPTPASLKNIERELKTDIGATLGSKDLSHWRAQGIQLLNTALTAVQGKSAAHVTMGWQEFTQRAIAALIESGQPIVLLLWGAQAQKLEAKLEPALQLNSAVRIIKGVHPSPLSANRGFFGSRPFSKINEALTELELQTIDWNSNAS